MKTIPTTTALATFLTVTVVAVAMAAGGERQASAAEGCGTVVVQFPPPQEGSGGAHDIRAAGVSCEKARSVARSCVDPFDDVDPAVKGGWTTVTWTGSRTLMTKGGNREKRISFQLVGGGGCGKWPRQCASFSWSHHPLPHQDLFFSDGQALGIGCSGARNKAKAWVRRGSPPCGLGRVCSVGKYRCRGKAADSTVDCVRQDNGYRFRWEVTLNP